MNRRIKISLTIFSLQLLLAIPCFGLVPEDSLRSIWSDASLSPSLRLQAVAELISSDQLHSALPDSIYRLAQSAYDLAAQHELKVDMADAKYAIGNVHSQTGNYPEAILAFETSIALLQEQHLAIKKAKVLNSLGNVFLKQSKYAKAIQHYSTSLEIAENKKDSALIGSIQNNMGLVYLDLKEYDQSKKYLAAALAIAKKYGSPISQARGLLNLGTILRNQKKFDSALQYYQQSLKILEEEKSIVGMAVCYSNLGLIYEQFEERVKALQYFRKSLQYHQISNNKKGISNCLYHLGNSYLDTQPDSALHLANQALQLAQDIGALEELSHAAALLTQLYEKKGEAEMAFEMNKIFNEAKDSMFSLENQKAVLINDFHRQQKTLLQDSNYEFEHQLNTYLKKIKKQQLITLFGVLFLIGGFGRFIYLQKNRNQAEKVQLLNKIEELKRSLAVQTISLGEEKTGVHLDKEKIEKHIQTKLGESSWMILNLLLKNPAISNKELAKEVSLSVEGVSSSLRRMYSSFEIISSSNKKIALITKAIRISTE